MRRLPTLLPLIFIAGLASLSCRRNAAEERDALERGMEAGLLDEQGRAMPKPKAYTPGRVAKQPPEAWLESEGLSPRTFTGTWEGPTDLGFSFPAPQALRLEDGNLLVSGGRTPSGISSGIVSLHPETGAAYPFRTMLPFPPEPHLALRLADGTVLFLHFGLGGPRAMHFLPLEDRLEEWPRPWPGTDDPEVRGALLPDGQVLLLAATMDGKRRPCAQVLDPKTRVWGLTEPLPCVPRRGALAWLGEGRLLITGGWDGDHGGNTAQAFIFDPTKGRFQAAGPMGTVRRNHTATLLPTGEVLIAGGYDARGELDTTEIFDPRTRRFRPGPKLPFPMARHAARLLGSGEVLLTGGGSVLIYDPWAQRVRVARSPDPIVPGTGEGSDPLAALGVWRENPAVVLDATGAPWLVGGRALGVGGPNLEGLASRTAGRLR